MELFCNYCPAKFSQFKELFDHWEDKHASILKRFVVKHLPTKCSGVVLAPSSQEACERLGWKISDCLVECVALNNHGLRQTPIKKISDKRKVLLPQYTHLITTLRNLCHNRSELSGDVAGWQTDYKVEPHHINGRNGNRLIDPFNIIMLTRKEHCIEEGRKIEGKRHTKEELLAIVRPLRIRQGFDNV